MEEWQIVHIDRNILKLGKLIRCTTGLKTWLKAAGFITDEEQERLNRIEDTKGSLDATNELIDILKGRSGGYKALMDVLQEYRQTGARNILQYGIQKRAGTAEEKMVQAIRLLDMNVEILGSIRKLCDLFPSFQRKDALEVLDRLETKYDIADIFQNCTVLKMEGYLPEIPTNYIKRAISNRTLLKPEIFKKNCVDVFVFKGVNRAALPNLVAPYPIRSSSNQRSIITCRHIYLDDDDDWNDMVDVCKTPMHLVKKEGESYVLERSTQVTSILIQYRLDQGKNNSITEEEFVAQLMTHLGENGALLCDIPGMGKTWLMQSIATQLRMSSTKSIIFFIQLTTFAQYLGTKKKPLGYHEALKFILEYSCTSPLVALLLTENAAKNGYNIVFFLDGFDEISNVYQEPTIMFLKGLRTNKNVRLIISSRPNMRERLEKTFNLVFNDILPFEIQDQINAIVFRWREKIPHGYEKKLTECAKQCIESVNIIQQNKTNELLGIPLKCYLLAVVNETFALQQCNQNRKKDFVVVELARLQSVFDLYASFIETLLTRQQNEAGQTNTGNDDVKSIIEYHTCKALELLFPEVAEVYSKTIVVNTSVQDRVNKLGLMCKTKDLEFEFIHRSFAEYFAGKFFTEFWLNIHLYEPSFIQTFGVCFITHVLKTSTKNKIGVHQLNYMKKTIPCSSMSVFPWLTEKIKFNSFSWFSVLWFMNFAYRTRQHSPHTAEVFKQTVLSKKTKDSFWKRFTLGMKAANTLYQCKEAIRNSVYLALMTCIDEGLTSIISLLVLLVTSLFDESERSSLLRRRDLAIESNVGVPILLCWLAARGNPENAAQVFAMFGESDNCLSEFCNNYPERYCNPLEVAVRRNDLDMVMFFSQKVHKNLTLLFQHVVCGETPTESETEVKAQIVLSLFGTIDKALQLSLSNGLAEPEFRTVVMIAWKLKASLKLASVTTKTKVLQRALQEYGDEKMIKLLLLLFPAQETPDIKFPASILLPISARGGSFTANEVLQYVDLEDARRVFLKDTNFDSCFCNMHKIETLKVFIKIKPSISDSNNLGRNYLHYAVMGGKVKWVEHLIESGYAINERDKLHNTPLHCVRMKGLLEITKMLVDSEADVNAINLSKRNVAHELLWRFKGEVFSNEVLLKWVNYMLENGFHELWNVRDYMTYTAYEMLSLQIGSKHAVLLKLQRSIPPE